MIFTEVCHGLRYQTPSSADHLATLFTAYATIDFQARQPAYGDASSLSTPGLVNHFFDV